MSHRLKRPLKKDGMSVVSRFYFAMIALLTIPSDSVLRQTDRVWSEPVSCEPTRIPVTKLTLFNGFINTLKPFGVETGAGSKAVQLFAGSVQSVALLLLVVLVVVSVVELVVVLLVVLVVLLVVVFVVVLLVVLVVVFVVFAVK